MESLGSRECDRVWILSRIFSSLRPVLWPWFGGGRFLLIFNLIFKVVLSKGGRRV